MRLATAKAVFILLALAIFISYVVTTIVTYDPASTYATNYYERVGDYLLISPPAVSSPYGNGDRNVITSGGIVISRQPTRD